MALAVSVQTQYGHAFCAVRSPAQKVQLEAASRELALWCLELDSDVRPTEQLWADIKEQFAPYTTDFSEYTAGQQPHDWTIRVGAADHAWQVVADAGYTGGKYVSDTTSTNNPTILAKDTLDGGWDSDQRVLCNSSSGTAVQQLLAARTRISAGGHTLGYRLEWSGGTTLRLFESYLTDNPSSFDEESAGAVLASAAKSFAVNDPFWMRLRVEGDRIQGKAWDADEEEPVEWDIDWTGEVRQGTPGHHGIGAIRGSGTRRFDVYSVDMLPPTGYGGKLPADLTEGNTFGCLGGGTILGDGRRLVTWRRANSHTSSQGVGMAALSLDGRLWGAPWIAHSDATYDVRHLMPTASRFSKTLLVAGNLFDHVGLTSLASGGLFVLRGTDPENLTHHVIADAFNEINAVTAPPVEVSPGTWLLPVYGRDSGGGSALFSRLLRSTDDGVTWNLFGTIAEGDVDGNVAWLEPNIARLANGDLICLLRTGAEVNVYQTFSADGGATWSTPEVAFAGIGPPHVLQLSGGALVAVYRATSGSSRGGYRTSTDGGQTWSEETLVYTAAQSWQHGQLAEISPTRALLYYWRRAGTVPGGEAAVGFTRVIDV